MSYQLQIKENHESFNIGYFDPTMKNKPASLAFRVVMVVSKSEATIEGARACAADIAHNDKRYKW